MTEFWNLPRMTLKDGHASNRLAHPDCDCGACRVFLAGRWVCLACQVRENLTINWESDWDSLAA